MKNSFWNKKTQDMTALDSLKYTAVLTAITYGICFIIFKLEDICDFFQKIFSKMKSAKDNW